MKREPGPGVEPWYRPGQGEVRGEDFQPSRLVAGQRAELDVTSDRRHQADVLPGHLVAAQEGGPGIIGPADPQQREQRPGQGAVRLLHAPLGAVEYRPPLLKRPGIVAGGGSRLAKTVLLAGGAVRHLVPGRGDRRCHQRRRGHVVAEAAGEPRSVRMDRPRTVTALPVAAFAFVEPAVDGGERDVRIVDQRASQPLQVPVDGVRQVADLGRKAIEKLQHPADGKRDSLPLRAVLVGVAEGDEHLGFDVVVPGLPRLLRQRLKALRLQRRPVRQAAQARRRSSRPDFLGRHRRSSSPSSAGGAVWVARSSNSPNARFSRAASAGRSGRCVISRA